MTIVIVLLEHKFCSSFNRTAQVSIWFYWVHATEFFIIPANKCNATVPLAAKKNKKKNTENDASITICVPLIIVAK